MSSDESTTRQRILDAALALTERGAGRGVRMQDVSKAAGVSRQALYLHFESRAALMVATARYGDEVHRAAERSSRYREAIGGIARLDEFVAFWGHYLPDIRGIASALMAARDTDAAAAAAWDDRMHAVHGECVAIVEALRDDGALAPGWTVKEASDLLWATLSIPSWESLVHERGWTTCEYVERMRTWLHRAIVAPRAGED